MKQFRAILADSLHESLDRKALLLLLVLSVLLVLFCLGISFDSEKLDTILERQVLTIDPETRGRGFSWGSLLTGMDVSGSDIKPAHTEDGWPDDVAGGYAVTLTFKSPEIVEELAHKWKQFKLRREQRWPEANNVSGTVSAEDRLAFIRERFIWMGYSSVAVKYLSSSPPTYRVAVRTRNPAELTAASKMYLLFGVIPIPLVDHSVAERVVQIQLALSNIFAGFIGVVVAVLVSSGFVPTMLQKGTLDLVLARPIGRVRLLLYKYIGAVCFIFMVASILIGGCWLAISLRTGYVNAWFLTTILTITATFAVVHSVSVVFGVLTRSGTIAGLAALTIWGFSGVLIGIRNNARLFFPNWLQNVLDFLYAIAPKTNDLASLNVYLLSRSHLSEEAYQRSFARMVPNVDWAYSIATTLAFTMAMLAFASWRFKKRDF